MLLQRWEAKKLRKEKSPQPGIELTTTRSRVWHAHHWATQAGHADKRRPWNPNYLGFTLAENVHWLYFLGFFVHTKPGDAKVKNKAWDWAITGSNPKLWKSFPRVNPLPHNLKLKCPWRRKPLKTLLVTSIFFYSNNICSPTKYRNHHLGYIYFAVCKWF